MSGMFSTMPKIDPSAYLDTDQGRKSLQIAAQQQFEESLKECTCWTVVASATQGDFSVHTELLSDQLNCSSNGRPLGIVPTYEVEATPADGEDDWAAGFDLVRVPLSVARITNLRLSLKPGEGRNLMKALDKREVNPNSSAKSAQFRVWTKPQTQLSTQGVSNTLSVQVIHIDYDSFEIPTGQTPTAAEASAALDAIVADRNQRREEGLALAAQRRDIRMGQTTMPSDVAADLVVDAASILADQEASL
jgi:hypothetical protein